MDKKLGDLIRIASAFRGFRSIRAAAIASEIGYSTINNWVRGTSIPSVDLLSKFARTIGVDMGYFTGDLSLEQACAAYDNRNEIYAVGVPKMVKLPYWDVPADPVNGRSADVDEPDGYISFPADANADFAAHITGVCMEPRICRGDFLGIKRQAYCSTGEVALIEVLETGDRMIKRSVMKKGRRYFAPDNEDAGEYAIPAEGCRVIGVGVALTRGKGGL